MAAVVTRRYELTSGVVMPSGDAFIMLSHLLLQPPQLHGCMYVPIVLLHQISIINYVAVSNRSSSQHWMHAYARSPAQVTVCNHKPLTCHW